MQKKLYSIIFSVIKVLQKFSFYICTCIISFIFASQHAKSNILSGSLHKVQIPDRVIFFSCIFFFTHASVQQIISEQLSHARHSSRPQGHHGEQAFIKKKKNCLHKTYKLCTLSPHNYLVPLFPFPSKRGSENLRGLPGVSQPKTNPVIPDS